MRINFTLDRFNSMLDVLMAEMEQEVGKNPEMLLEDAVSFVAQFQNELQKPEFSQTVRNIQTVFNFLPEDSVALLLGVGYKMGKDDAVNPASSKAEVDG